MKKYSKKPAQNPALDLFGQVPITASDVVLWCEVVAQIPEDSPRFAAYVRAWHVLDKIKAAKLGGTFDAATQRKEADLSAPVRLQRILALRYA